MGERELKHRLAVYSLAINLAGLCFAAAALLLLGPLEAIITFLATVSTLLGAIYRKKMEN